MLLRAQGKPVEAEAAYRAAIRAESRALDAYTNLGILLNGQKRTQEAVVCFCKVITLRPKHPEARRLLALAHCTLGEVDKAVAIFEEWLEEEPDNPIALHMLAACSGRDVPARASDGFVEKIFDSFAGQLRLEARQAAVPRARDWSRRCWRIRMSRRRRASTCSMPDAAPGCAVRSSRRTRGGWSASICPRGMLAQAEARKVYDELSKAELTAYLRDCARGVRRDRVGRHARVFRALEDVVAAAARALRPGGRLDLHASRQLIDAGSDAGYRLSHARPLQPRARSTSSACWRRRVSQPEIVPAELRLEAGEPVAGLVVRATKPTDAGMNHA